MIIANRTLSVIDTAFNVIEQIERIDYVALGRNVIDKAIVTAAVIIGVVSYLYTALLLWWEDHGQTIIINTTRFVINTVDYTHEVYLIGGELRRFITKTLNHAADSAFFTIAAL